MTQQELNEIPEMGGIGYRDNGDGTRTPVMMPSKVLYTAEDEPAFVRDEYGQGWALGWADGQRWKRRLAV